MELVTVDSNLSHVWDNFVAGATHGHFMQSYAWGEFKASAGSQPRFFMVFDGEHPRAAVLVNSLRIPFLPFRTYTAPRGPTIDPKDIESRSFLMSSLRRYVIASGGIFLRFDPYLRECDVSNEEWERLGIRHLPNTWSFWNAPKYVFWLDLKEGVDTLFNRLPTKIRTQIRLPHKKGVSFETGGQSDLNVFHKLMVSTAGQKDIGVHSLPYYEKLFASLNSRDMIGLFLAKYQGKTIATGMSVKYGKRAWLLYAASDHEYHSLRANRALQWEMIRWAAENQCEVYDFRGTATEDPPNSNDSGYGVYLYKKSFGAEFTRLAGYYDLVVNRPLYRLFRMGEERALPPLYRMRVLLQDILSRKKPSSQTG